jgi:hypothetical protein
MRWRVTDVKMGGCRPGENQVLPIAAQMLIKDESRRIWQMAAGVLGPSVHRHPDVLRALEYARDHDPHPVVRKIAGWYTPAGPIYKRLAPKTVRCESDECVPSGAGID